MQRQIERRDDQLEELERIAGEERRSVDQLVQLAVSDYLARHHRDWSDWSRRWGSVAVEVRSSRQPVVTPEELEAGITAASEEVRTERAARRGAGAVDADRS
jgi:hypothetical protein